MAKTTGCVPETLHRKTTEANLWCRAPDHVGKSILRYAVVAAGVDIGGRPQRVSRANSKTTVCPLRRAKNDTSSAWLQLPSNEPSNEWKEKEKLAVLKGNLSLLGSHQTLQKARDPLGGGGGPVVHRASMRQPRLIGPRGRIGRDATDGPLLNTNL
ncbi:unnamed protein product [Gadus morhua 'NCC']